MNCDFIDLKQETINCKGDTREKKIKRFSRFTP